MIEHLEHRLLFAQMTFMVNNSPFAGKDGRYVTSRQIRERLDKAAKQNVAIRIREITVTSLGGLFNATVVSGAVRAALQPVLDVLDSYILNKLSSEPFGIEFAGADVMNQGVNCTARRLGS